MQTLFLDIDDQSPASVVAAYRRRAELSIAVANSENTQRLLIQYLHKPWYLLDAQPIALVAIVQFDLLQTGLKVHASVLPVEQFDAPFWGSQPSTDLVLSHLAKASAPWLNLSMPLGLQPVHIPKPWGQEVWFTGMEIRGQSGVGDGHFSLPLPWILDLLGESHSLTLLKVLDPFAEEVLGDLYFELHETKQEVYIVTRVDPQAWPDGVGEIFMGFSSEKRNQYPSREAFVQAYLAVVDEYRQLRQQLDAAMDGIGLPEHHARLSPAEIYAHKQQAIADLANMPPLIEKETLLRQQMNQFIARRPLRVGDVVKVPCLTPHSLQHGIQVVEFQTPVYERKILSFGQKVMTQAHWDTHEAMAITNLDEPRLDGLVAIHAGQSFLLELIADFDEFRVERLGCRSECSLDLAPSDGLLLMLIHGEASYIQGTSRQLDNTGSGIGLTPGSAWLLSAITGPLVLRLKPGALVLAAISSSKPWLDLPN